MYVYIFLFYCSDSDTLENHKKVNVVSRQTSKNDREVNEEDDEAVDEMLMREEEEFATPIFQTACDDILDAGQITKAAGQADVSQWEAKLTVLLEDVCLSRVAVFLSSHLIYFICI